MAQDEDGMSKGLIIGFVAGSIVGGVLALLFAPKAGHEFRSELKSKAEGLADDAQTYVKRARSKATEIINDSRAKSDTLVSDARRHADTIMGEAEKILSDARKRVGGDPQKSS